MHRGVATFTLDYGKCPKWLFDRMVTLGREMTRVIVEEYGADQYIKRIADPVWFQSLGTVLAFDWNASGLTTILTAALKEGIRGREKEFGIFICGGKGKTSLKTPEEIMAWGEKADIAPEETQALVYNSKMSAKVDSALVQDGYAIYHHSFFFSKNGAWAVVQQGMNTKSVTARRYHWFSESAKDLVCEPHSGIASQLLSGHTLNLSAQKSSATRELSTELVRSGHATLMKDIQLLRKHSSTLHTMVSFRHGSAGQLTLLELENREFTTHPVVQEDFSKSRYLEKVFSRVCYEKPENYEQLLAIPGVGPKTMRALALVGEVVYGAKPSYEDPARYSFAHGGKDATPYPVDRKTYDTTISVMRRLVSRTRLEQLDKQKILERIPLSTV